MKRSTCYHRWIALATLAALAILSVVAQSSAQDASPVVAGRRAFEDTGTFPWYDAEKDALRPLELPPPRPDREPWRFSFEFLRPVAWVVLAAAVALIIFMAWRAYRQRQEQTRQKTTAKTARLPASVEALGFLGDRPRGDLLAEARRLYQEGNYSEAILYLFSYELVELDRFALVRLARGKTNRQYVREAARSPAPALANALGQTMVAFESVFFGRRELDRSGFEACWNHVGEFERLAAREGT